ncbi:RagB/SusD family nutrient uptake outer membrane protein [Cyclobacterium amurskyense]|uniref:Putative nutrient binding outer membrane protein n=1 Tax=Cyclobacterium amurskyense TaxID=320787 RepID=A0A0H4PBT1_9BACT|nr:RagB/SusD family nutrient uptake outer membrane protein [Cyclobacterium amurskyense]AKP51709.1 Putative nutrient binding outer membrane protein [Cyclobacterium amurskyense]|tara:strand:+ start:1390 stop:2823 length:1434 start_codon:yes stop_codon:yes gene_type:complete
MKKYIIYILTLLAGTSCSDFLELQPEHQISDGSFYKNANDFETALIGSYSSLQNLYDANLVYVGELTTDNAEIQWTTPSISEVELDEVNFTPSNGFLNSIWQISFNLVSQSNNILSRIDDVDMGTQIRNQIKGEALFLRAFGYFNLVRTFGPVPIVDVAFRSPGEIAAYDMTRKPEEAVYQILEADLNQATSLLTGVEELGKSRASSAAAMTLLGKVYLTQMDYSNAETALKGVVESNAFSLESDYKRLFTNGNDELSESIFEIKYMSGNLGVGNGFSSTFTPARFDMDIFPNQMQGSGRILPTPEMSEAYEDGDLRRPASIGDSVRVISGGFEKELYGLKFVDFTTGVQGDGGINFTALRYADVLLMYAEALNQNGKQDEAMVYLNMVRERAGLTEVSGLDQAALTVALAQERRVELFLEGHRWFDLVRTGKLLTEMNAYFERNNLNFEVQAYKTIMPIPLREIDINPSLGQNTGY